MRHPQFELVLETDSHSYGERRPRSIGLALGSYTRRLTGGRFANQTRVAVEPVGRGIRAQLRAASGGPRPYRARTAATSSRLKGRNDVYPRQVPALRKVQEEDEMGQVPGRLQRAGKHQLHTMRQQLRLRLQMRERKVRQVAFVDERSLTI